MIAGFATAMIGLHFGARYLVKSFGILAGLIVIAAFLFIAAIMDFSNWLRSDD
jgi:hypothetical protein